MMSVVKRRHDFYFFPGSPALHAPIQYPVFVHDCFRVLGNGDFAAMALIQPPLVRRLQMLGTLSLLAIVVGGSLLIFVGANVLSGR